MKKQNLITTLALSAILGSAIALPATASAHEVIKEKRVKIIKTTQRRDDHRRGDVDRWYVERHREVSSRWAPPRYRYKHDRGYGHKYGHHKHRYERHDYRDYRPVREHRDYQRHDRDGVRVRIDYDFWL